MIGILEKENECDLCGNSASNLALFVRKRYKEQDLRQLLAKRENEAILLEDNYKQNYGYDPNSPEAHIMFSMFQNAFLEQSIAFAEKVQGQAKVHTGLKNRGVKQAGFIVLKLA